jgi:uncharacterized protein involved in exopolysaccharide biosynthesis
MPTTILNTTDGALYENEIDLRRYGLFIAAHWMILVGCAVAGSVVAITAASLIPPRFEAGTMLIVESAGPTPLTPSTAKALLVNSDIVSETIKQLDLTRDGITVEGFIADALDVKPVPSTNLVKVSVTLHDAAKARQTAALLAAKMVELANRIGRDAAPAPSTPIERQLADADRRLKEAEQRIVEFQTSGQLDNLEAETRADTTRRADVAGLSIRLESERARLAALEREVARQPAELHAPVPAGAPGQLRARQNATGASGSNPLANPVYEMLQYDIAVSRATIAQLEREEREMAAMTSSTAASRRRAELYRSRMELARLQAMYDSRSRTYNDLASRHEGIPTASVPQVQIIEPPAQPDGPLPRHRRQFAILGGLIGLVCGIVIAVVIDRGDRLAAGRTAQ